MTKETCNQDTTNINESKIEVTFLCGAGAESKIFNNTTLDLPNGKEYSEETIFFNKIDNKTQDEFILLNLLKKYYDSYYSFNFYNSNNRVKEKYDIHQEYLNFFPFLHEYLENNIINSNDLYHDLRIYNFLEEDLFDLHSYIELNKWKNINGQQINYKSFKESCSPSKHIDYSKEPLLLNIDNNTNEKQQSQKSTGIFPLDQDFHTIINPKKYGVIKYSRLLNLFWLSHYSIYSKCCNLLNNKNSKIIYGDQSLDFKVIKNNCNELLELIKTASRRDVCETLDNSYYGIIYKYFKDIKKDYQIVTTNYSPYCFYKDHKAVQLHGNLWTFESQLTRHHYDLTTTDDFAPLYKNNDLFPYIVCQSALKPIINPTQVEAYYKFGESLKSSHTLVILGYELSDDDDHINNYIRDFYLKDNNNKIIYLHYTQDKNIDKDIEQRIKDIIGVREENGQFEFINISGSNEDFINILQDNFKLTPKKEPVHS